MPSLRKTQHKNTTTKKRTFFITPTTNGIHSNGPNRRIPPSIQQGQQICSDSSLHAYRIHILYTTKIQTSGRCNKSLHQPHMLHIRTIKENINGQWNIVQEQTLDRSIGKAEN